jgi:hypothetical protein
MFFSTRARVRTLAIIGALAAGLIGPGAASAGTKPFSLTMAPKQVAGGTVTITATYTNENGPGGQQVGSANLIAPAPFRTTGASVPTGTATLASSCTFGSTSGSCVQLRNINVAGGKSITVTLSVDTGTACTAGTYNWTTQAKQSNDFSGTGNDLTLDTATSSLSTTVSGACSLAFATQPHDADVGQTISGVAFNPTGPPVTVDVVDGSGHPVNSTAPVTIAIGNNPGGSTLSGTATVSAVGGVATFSDLSLDKAANGYTLSATSGALPGASSTTFSEQSTSTPCPENQSCQTDTGTSAGDLQIVASPDPNRTDQGTLTESVNPQHGAQLNCAGYTSADPNTYEFYVSSINRSKTGTLTIRQPAIPLSGTITAILGTQQLCFGATYGFLTSSGAPASAGTLPDGTPGFIGLLPNCGAAGATVCVQSRSSKLDASSPIGFDIVVTFFVPEGQSGDPYTH